MKRHSVRCGNVGTIKQIYRRYFTQCNRVLIWDELIEDFSRIVQDPGLDAVLRTELLAVVSDNVDKILELMVKRGMFN